MKITLNDIARKNLVYFLNKKKLSVIGFWKLNPELLGDKSNLYKYIHGDRKITLNVLQKLAFVLEIEPSKLIDESLYNKNLKDNYDFSLAHGNLFFLKQNKERNNYIYEQRNLKPKRTLQSIADEFGLTRERVRQIYNKYESIKQTERR